jgi:putative transposase
MARIARVIAPGFPHHITQRGNRRLPTFFRNEDYEAYLALLAEWCCTCRVEVWAYCLMPNHVHLIAVPETREGLRQAIGEAHRRYTRLINSRSGWSGHLWQGRFASFVMDENYLLAATRYVELNPVRARLTADPFAWRWSSAAAHLAGQDDSLVKVAPLLEMAGDWRQFLLESPADEVMNDLRKHERTGRPLGRDRFLQQLEDTLSRVLRKKKPGPKGKKEIIK